MLIYPVSFQRWRVIPEGNPTLTGLMFVRRSGAAKLPPGKGDPQSSQNRVMPDNRKQTPKRLDGGSGVLDNACRTEGAFTPLNPDRPWRPAAQPRHPHTLTATSCYPEGRAAPGNVQCQCNA